MREPVEIKLGKATRRTYATIDEVLEMPDLIEIQTESYRWFAEQGLKEVFEDISPITDYTQNLILEFIDYKISDKPKYDVEECKKRDTTYAAPMRVEVRLINKENGEIKEQEVFMGDFPLMTEKGTFIINGAERVIVSQLVRSPGVYYAQKFDKYGKRLFSSTVIPNRGAWLEFESDANDILWVRVDRTRKLPATVLIRALGYGNDSDIKNLFGETSKILNTIDKDSTKTHEEGLIEIYRRLRPGEPPTVEGSKQLLESFFFEPRRYDLARVGRYKFNKKLALYNRIEGRVLAEDAVNTFTGEVIAQKGESLSKERAMAIENAGIERVVIENANGENFVILSNHFVDPSAYLDFDPEEVGLNEKVYYPAFFEILNEFDKDNLDLDGLKNELKKSRDVLIPKHITLSDIMASINYQIHLEDGFGHTDDIDHLGNRRLRNVGELLQNQFRIGLSRMERVVRERMTVQDIDVVTPQTLINIRPVIAALKEFFGSSQLSQFMDQHNPLSELTHKRRLSALGPGGLSRERAGYEVRDVHDSHYGRMCPVETPEGPNIGLIGAMSTYARINKYGFIESPYRRVDKEKSLVTNEIVYLTADQEDELVIAQANAPLDEEGHYINDEVMARDKHEIKEVSKFDVDFMDVSPKQVVSVATSMIPFLENDDASRALMGANMQRQAVPLVRTESPIVGTGMEYKAAKDSGVVIISKRDGVVSRVSANEITVTAKDRTEDVYKLLKFQRSNQGMCINQKPIVSVGEEVTAGQILADGPSTDNGELALGRNILIGFMTWEGYNYEDAILISEELVKDDILTSIHIEEYEIEARDTKLGPEEITRDISNVGEDALKDLDERGIIRIGAEVHSSDILVGKVTPKGETELTAEERLLRAIFGEKAREVRDTSLRLPHGAKGMVVDVLVFTRENGDELSPGVNQLVRVYIAQKRKISVGDKMAGRHGNKGVISRVLPEEDMPFLPDGTPLQIVLNPLGVPSRMNIGQVLEVHLGIACKMLGYKIATPVFDGAHEDDIMYALEKAGKTPDGKTLLYDGRTGEPFENEVTVGYMYMLKLAHLVDDKIHARSTGPYSLVTQQPLGGKAQFGGQRFGEMEVWALEAYGAAHTLQEILTVKSDDTYGRVKTYEAIVKGENIPEPGVPESFRVLIKEMQSLGLDIKVTTDEHKQIAIKDIQDAELSDDLNIDDIEKDDDISIDDIDISSLGEVTDDIFSSLGEEVTANTDEIQNDEDVLDSAISLEEVNDEVGDIDKMVDEFGADILDDNEL